MGVTGPPADATVVGGGAALDTHRDFALRVSGYVDIAAAGRYRFATESNDGSALWVGGDGSGGGEPTVANDGQHYAQTRTSAEVHLGAGAHRLLLTYAVHLRDGSPCLPACLAGWLAACLPVHSPVNPTSPFPCGIARPSHVGLALPMRHGSPRYFHCNGKVWEGTTHRGPTLRVTHGRLPDSGARSAVARLLTSLGERLEDLPAAALWCPAKASGAYSADAPPGTHPLPASTPFRHPSPFRHSSPSMRPTP